MQDKKIMLEAKHITKAFGATHACTDISLTINRGEVHGIIGENGSGKTTFCSMLCGVYGVDSGEFFLNGKSVAPKNQIEANEDGISMIIQEMGTLSGLTVGQNMFLGKEKEFYKGWLLNTKQLNQTADNILASYGLNNISSKDMVDLYSFEQRKLIEIAKATHFKPNILIVDETTTALSQDGREEIYKVMKDIKNDDRSVIFISHDLQEVLDKTDAISILRDGIYITTVRTKDVTENDLKILMVGREIDKKYYRNDYEPSWGEEIVLNVKNLCVPNYLNNINIQLHRGEILGIGGLSDCGIHEVGRAIFGGSYDKTGKVILGDGSEIKTIPDAINHNIAYTSKNRDIESVIVNDSIKNNICLPSLDKVKGKVLISSKKEIEFSVEYAKLLSIKCENVEQYVSNLSGGNKQKVVLARWLGKGSEILLLDSPTRGIDIKVKADIYSLMEKLKSEGKSIILISEEITELIGMSDRILILKNAKINGEFLRSPELSEDDLIKKMI